MKTYRSNLDSSVNFVQEHEDGGFFESRFVQREEDYFITYLSSHTGCKHACRFCHLTATRQTMMTPASLADFINQARPVINHYLSTGGKATKVNFNFMARGDALSNPTVLQNFDLLADSLSSLIKGCALTPTFNVSTILPKSCAEIDLSEVFKSNHKVILYYSLYSMSEDFRKRWMTNAMNRHEALDKLAAYQQKTGNELVLHWAYINGQNDSEDQVEEIKAEVAKRGILARFNLVRYNPYSARQGEESPENVLTRNFKSMSENFASNSRIVPRVGFDVKASCGMFVEKTS